MEPDLFAGIHVRDFDTARDWYERLFGGAPAFLPHATEAVWELAEHRYVYVVEDAGRAGGSALTIFAGDLDELVTAIAERGIDPAEQETYSNGTRKTTYRDADGNEVGFGSLPAD